MKKIILPLMLCTTFNVLNAKYIDTSYVYDVEIDFNEKKEIKNENRLTTTTIVPYYSIINYDKSSKKDKGILDGFYLSNGSLSYLLEINYSKIKLKYKDSLIPELLQEEMSLKYNKYYYKYSYKVGLHTNSTTDTSLQNGNTIILGLKGWKYYNYNKLTYGVDYYHTMYANGTNLENEIKKININQITPYVSYFNYFSNFQNNVKLKMNVESIKEYDDKTLYSFELEDILYLGKYNLSFNYFKGEMQTGIRSGGDTVYNSKDKLEQEFGIKLTYNYSKDLQASMSYKFMNYYEFENKDTSNQMSVFSISYKF